MSAARRPPRSDPQNNHDFRPSATPQPPLGGVVGHLPPPGRRPERLRHVLAELAQALTAAARAGGRRIDHHPLARQMIGERIALGAAAGESADRRRPGGRQFRRQFVFRGAGFELFKFERQLVDQPRRALLTAARRRCARAWRS
jgi:hypothetical protein